MADRQGSTFNEMVSTLDGMLTKDISAIGSRGLTAEIQ
jgi:hypothetical protein